MFFDDVYCLRIRLGEQKTKKNSTQEKWCLPFVREYVRDYGDVVLLLWLIVCTAVRTTQILTLSSTATGLLVNVSPLQKLFSRTATVSSFSNFIFLPLVEWNFNGNGWHNPFEWFFDFETARKKKFCSVNLWKSLHPGIIRTPLSYHVTIEKKKSNQRLNYIRS